MRAAIFAASLLAVAATPAFAGTVEEIIAHGMVVSIGPADVEMSFTPDGRLTGQILGAGPAPVPLTGTWRRDGERFCTANNLDPVEVCHPYPRDRKSGDVFDLVTPEGTAKIRIR